jgi:hypothetical protein
MASRNEMMTAHTMVACLGRTSLDPTRLVIGNDGWEHIVSDVFTVHDYSSEGATLRERYGDHEAVERTLEQVQPCYRSVVLPGLRRSDEPLMVTEFGGLTLQSDAGSWNAYGTVASAEEFLAKYTELVDILLDSPVVAGFCYTQLTDTVQEQNGLLGADRQPKLDPAAVRRVNQRTSVGRPRRRHRRRPARRRPGRRPDGKRELIRRAVGYTSVGCSRRRAPRRSRALSPPLRCCSSSKSGMACA